MNIFMPTMASLTNPKVLGAAYDRVRSFSGNVPGPDGFLAADLGSKKSVVRKLRDELDSGRYSPGPLRSLARKEHDGGSRWMLVPNFKDRVVGFAVARCAQTAVLPVVRGFEVGWNSNFHGAIDAVEVAAIKSRYALRFEFEGLHESFGRETLCERLAASNADRSFVELVDHLLSQQVAAPDGGTVEAIGPSLPDPLSALAVEVHLVPAMSALEDTGIELIRYGGTAFVGCVSRKEAQRRKAVIKAAFRESALQISSPGFKVHDLRGEGAPFLGFRIFRFFCTPDLDLVEMLAKKIREAVNPRTMALALIHTYDYGVGRDAFWKEVALRTGNREVEEAVGECIASDHLIEPMTSAGVQFALQHVLELEKAYARRPKERFGRFTLSEPLFILNELWRWSAG